MGILVAVLLMTISFGHKFAKWSNRTKDKFKCTIPKLFCVFTCKTKANGNHFRRSSENRFKVYVDLDRSSLVTTESCIVGNSVVLYIRIGTFSYNSCVIFVFVHFTPSS